MGWGVTRNRVYNLLLWITCQALESKDSSDEKPVSEVFRNEAAMEVTISPASAGAYHAMDSRNDQASGRRGSCQGHAWSSVRECISGPHGMIDFRSPLPNTEAPA